MKNYVRQSALSAAHFLLLAVIPIASFAFDGKLSYSNGSPAAGAQVILIIDDPRMKADYPNGSSIILPQVNTAPGNMSGNSTPPNAFTPASPKGNPLPNARIKTTTTSDAAGRFHFPNQPLTRALIQIKAADGKDFATVTLPAKLFANGELAVVLQPQ
jgi:hypothetical protein